MSSRTRSTEVVVEELLGLGSCFGEQISYLSLGNGEVVLKYLGNGTELSRHAHIPSLIEDSCGYARPSSSTYATTTFWMRVHFALVE